MSFSVLSFLAYFLVPQLLPAYSSATPGVEATPTLTISPSNTIAFSVDPGDFENSSQTVTVETTNSTGYTLTITPSSGNSTDLVNASLSEATIPSIASSMSSSAISSSNTAVYGLSIDNGTTYLPVTNGATLKSTNAPTDSTTGAFTLTLGAKTITSTPAGTYTKSFTLSAVTNAVNYSIVYEENTEDTVTNFPSDYAGTTSGVTVYISDQVPTRTGYKFLHWNTEDDDSGTSYNAGGTVTIDPEITNSITLYAIWGCGDGYICYNDNGATAGQGTMSQAVLQSEAYTAGSAQRLVAPNYSKTGYGFAGWNTQADGSGTYYGPNQTIAMPNPIAPVELYAIWLPAEQGVTMQTFNPSVAPYSTAITGTMIALTDTRDNQVYTVVKLEDGNFWMAENLRLGSSVTASTMASGSSWLGGNFTKLPASTALDWGTNTENEIYGPSVDDNTYTTATLPQLNDNNSDRTLDASYIVNENTKYWWSYGYYYSWASAKGNTLAMNNMAQSASHVTSICPTGWHLPSGGSTGEYGTLLTIKEGQVDANDPTYDNSSAVLRSYPNNFTLSGRWGGATVYEKHYLGIYWTSSAYNADNAYRFVVGTGNSAGMSSNRKWNGYSVRCVADNGFYVNYHANNGTNDAAHVPYPLTSSTLTVSDSIFSKQFYDFVKWNTAADGSGTDYTAGATYNIPNGSVSGDSTDLYAIWTIKPYTIRYRGNGGTGNMDHIGHSNIYEGDSVGLTAPAFTRTGYAFVGWSLDPNADPDDPNSVISGPNEIITAPNYETYGDGNNVFEYAIWKQSEGYLQNFSCSSLSVGDITALTDIRDGQTYMVTKHADGRCWMAENLRLDLSTADITPGTTNNPTSTFLEEIETASSTMALPSCTNTDASCIERVVFDTEFLTDGLGNIDSSRYSYGVYYNWYTATAGNGKKYIYFPYRAGGDICPTGWQLPTQSEYSGLITSTGVTGDATADAVRTYPYNFVNSGRLDEEGSYAAATAGLYWTSEAISSNDSNAYRFVVGTDAVVSDHYKVDGYAVRCIAVAGVYHTLTVSYGTGVASITVDGNVVANNGTVSLLDGTSHTISVSFSTGYELDSWSATSGNIASTTITSTKFVMGGANGTLTATGKKINYTVKYNANGGACQTSGTTTASCMKNIVYSNVNLGDKFDLFASNYSRSGYGFAGWSTSSSAQPGNGTIYGPNEHIEATSSFLANAYDKVVTLYAVWVESSGNLQNFNCSTLASGAVTALKDTRDNQVYAVAKLADGNCWMIENLRLEATNSTGSTNITKAQGYGASFTGLATSETANFSNSTTANSIYSTSIITGSNQGYRFPRYNNSNTASRASNPTASINVGTDTSVSSSYNFAVYSYGNYYTWSAAKASIADLDSSSSVTSANIGTSICPAGWKLPYGGDDTTTYGGNTTGGYYYLNYKLNSNSNVTDSTANMKLRKYPNNFLYQMGYYNGSSITSRGGGYGRYWTSKAYSATTGHNLQISTSAIVPGTGYNNKYFGFSVRCVIGYPAMQKVSSWGGSVNEGQEIVVVDTRDQKTYRVARIGGKLWMTRNLRTTGTVSASESNFTSPSTFKINQSQLTATACQSTSGYSTVCYLSGTDGEGNSTMWYNYAAATAGTITGTANTTDASKDICPSGWRLPTDAESSSLATALGSSTSIWRPSTGGYYQDGSVGYTDYGYFWTSTAGTSDVGRLGYRYTGTSIVTSKNYARRNGFFIRCIATTSLSSTTLKVRYGTGVASVTVGGNTIANNGTTTVTGGTSYSINMTPSAGYEFTRWAASTGTLGSATTKSTTYKVTSSGTTPVLTAYAQKIAYTVQYDANGGRCEDSGEVTTTCMQNVKHTNVNLGDTFDLFASNYSRAGYGFVGWSTNSSAQPGDGTSTIYGPNETIKADSSFTATASNKVITLYAIWVQSSGNFQSFDCSVLPSGGVIALTDTRDNNTYAVAKLADGNCWMIENLRLEATDSRGDTNIAKAQGYGAGFTGLANAEISGFTTNDANSLYSMTSLGGSNKPYRFPRYNNYNTTNAGTTNYRATNPSVTHDIHPGGSFINHKNLDDSIYSYGNYYTWAAVKANVSDISSNTAENMATSICPNGWRLPYGNDNNSTYGGLTLGGFALLDTSTEGPSGSFGTGHVQDYSTDASLRWRKYPYNFIYAGYFADSGASNRGNTGYYWSATTYNAQKAYYASLTYDTINPGANSSNKYNAYTVRCVINNPLRTLTVQYGTNVTDVKVDGETVANNGTVSLVSGLAHSISATLDSGYAFDSWSVSGTGASVGSASDQNTTIIVGSTDATLTATARVAVETVLDTGTNVNVKLKNLANGTSNASTVTSDSKIKSIQKADTLPSGFTASSENTISDSNSSAHPVYIFFDNTNDAGIMYYYTEAETIYANVDSSYMFITLTKLSDCSDISEWDTSNVTNMAGMFYQTGYDASTFSLDLSDWNTSSVMNMEGMFTYAGRNASTFSLDLSGWDTSSVTNISSMFASAGFSATTWSLIGPSGWDTSKVTDIYQVFANAGYSATNFSLDLSGWDTSSVTDMSGVFSGAGRSATTWSIGDLSSWDTSSVEYMSAMFAYAGYNATTWSIGDLSGWDTSSLLEVGNMFAYAGYNASAFSLDLSGWDTSNVDTATYMFYNAGYSATNFTVDLSGWNTSAFTGVGLMFSDAGHNATTWKVIIAPTNGDGVNNDTTHLYGEDSSTYAEPASGRQFTLSHNLTLSFGTGVASVTINSRSYGDGDIVALGVGVTYNINMTPESGYGFDSWSVSGTGTTLGSASAKKTTLTMGTTDATLTVTARTPIETTLDTGPTVGIKILNLANGGYYDNTEGFDEEMKAFRRAYSLPSGFVASDENTISDANSSAHPVYIFFDDTNYAGIMYYYTDANIIYANADSSYMFSEAWALSDISGLADFDTSRVEDMSYMFQYAAISDVDALAGWNTSNVTNMTGMFGMDFQGSNRETFDINGISGWDTSKVTDMSGMFGGCHGLLDLSPIADWDVTEVHLDKLDSGFWAMFEDVPSTATSGFSFSSRPGYIDTGDLGTYVPFPARVLTISSGAGVTSVTVNGVSYSGGDTVKLDEGLTYNIDATLSSGYIFNGWAVSGDGNSLSSASSKSTTLTLNSTPATLTATARIATEASLDTGENINAKMKNLANNVSNSTKSTQDTKIKEIRKASALPAGFAPSAENTISDANASAYPVYIFFDDTNNAGIMYYYTEAETVYTNIYSSSMFQNLRALSSAPGVSDLNTSRTEDMKNMFNDAGYSASALSLDLSSWDTSRVTNMSSMFNEAGYSASTVSINLSDWDTSSVTNMNNMFANAGHDATTWTVTIAPTNGDGINNDTTHLYGVDSSTYASPASGRTFTLTVANNSPSPSQQSLQPQSLPQSLPAQSTNLVDAEDETQGTGSESGNAVPLGVNKAVEEGDGNLYKGNGIKDKDVYAVTAIAGAVTVAFIIIAGKRRKKEEEEEQK